MNPKFPKRLYEAHKSIDESTEKRGAQKSKEELAEETTDQILADSKLKDVDIVDNDISKAA